MVNGMSIIEDISSSYTIWHWPLACSFTFCLVRNFKILVYGLHSDKRDATSTTILQHFYNKSWVVSYYWFKFEFSTEITFLTQQ